MTNKLFGFPIFLAIMLFIFWATFFVGQYPMDWIESGVEALSDLTKEYMPDGILKDLVADGIIGGVGGVIVFLPNILILYFCISFMEDSGYMARAAFIMDKIMHRVGLHGKSFIPLVMGFGCNVPAILATRAIESRSSRLITILINPFMSCSARLPLYVLLIGTFFYQYAAWVFLGLYVLGIALGMLTARLLRRFVFHKDETPFVMELPPYRLPTFKASMRHTWAKGVQYLRKMGGIILFASIVVWALNYFPHHDTPKDFTTETTTIDMSRDSYLEAAGKAVNPRYGTPRLHMALDRGRPRRRPGQGNSRIDSGRAIHQRRSLHQQKPRRTPRDAARRRETRFHPGCGPEFHGVRSALLPLHGHRHRNSARKRTLGMGSVQRGL